MNQMKSIQAEANPPAAVEVTETKPLRNMKRWVIMFAVPLMLLVVGGYFWLTSGRSVSTDNAYVKQDIVSVSTQINGPIVEVFVRENQHVNRGDPLYRIDPGTAQVALLQAQAQLAAAELQTRQLGVVAAGTGGDIVGASANLSIMRRALARQQALLNRGFTTRSDYDDAVNEVQKAQTQLANARAQAANANAAIAPAGSQPQIAAARAAIAKAQLDLIRGLVRAPETGIVANSDRLLVGQAAITGVAMLSIVKDHGGWVEANFKEGDLAKMQVGQPATLKFDAYPGLKVRGHVCSIGAGTGSEFSVLPAQNANGNWVKVTQRVPVRVCFDEKPSRTMIAGLSAQVEVDLQTKR